MINLTYALFLCVHFFFSVNFFPPYDLCYRNFVYFSVVFSAQQPAATNSSSSEDEAGRSAGTVVRRRRLRKNTTSIVTEPEEEEEAALESGQSEEEEEEERDEGEQEAEVKPAAALDVRMQGSSILNKCILIALVVAISMGFGHFYGKTFPTELEDFTVNTENILHLNFPVSRN